MKLVILYGSQSGTAERQAFRVARMALQRGATGVRCLPADDTAVADWPGFCASDEPSHLVLILANANQGEAPETYRRSWACLLSAEAPSMKGLSYAVFGLGDSLYAKFNYMAKMTHNRLRQLGGQPLLLRGLGDESDAKGLDDALLPWLAELWAALGLAEAASGGGDTVIQQPLDAKFFPLYNAAIHEASTRRDEEATEETTQTTFPPRREPVTFACTVRSNERLTASDHFQAVHHLDLDMTPASAPSGSRAPAYEVGDALGVYCSNTAEQVQYMLTFYNLTGSESITVAANAADGLLEQTARPFLNQTMTTRELFTHYFDLEAVTEQDFFWMMSFFVEATTPAAEGTPSDGDASLVEEYRERLRELANPTNPDDFLVYSYREKRNVCEVLLDYNVSHEIQVRPPLAYLLSFLTPMRPRLFSLSSSPLLDAAPCLSLTVAKLDWQTPMRRHRHGMCSAALTAAQAGDVFQCFFWEGTLTVPPSPTPLLLVATGSGIAPMRALIRHCAAKSESGWRDTPIYLFFGCRHAAKDYLYEAEWARFRSEGVLNGLSVFPAFSRDDPSNKLYVQHKLGQTAARVGSLLQSTEAPAIVYVCGNAKNMPKDVQSVLQDIVDQVCCGGDEAMGQQFMKQMQREGRYQVDTWSA